MIIISTTIRLIKRNAHNHIFDGAYKKLERDNSHILNYATDNVTMVNVKSITYRHYRKNKIRM